MTVFVALLRAVNVGGTGKLPMADLRRLCAECGFERAETYIASGNAVFESDESESAVAKKLEAALAACAGKKVGVLIRSAAEMAAVAAENPFPGAPPARVLATFLPAAPPRDLASTLKGVVDEEVRPGRREIYVFYPNGSGRSKLKLPGVDAGTARNMNTVARLAEMAAR